MPEPITKAQSARGRGMKPKPPRTVKEIKNAARQGPPARTRGRRPAAATKAPPAVVKAAKTAAKAAKPRETKGTLPAGADGLVLSNAHAKELVESGAKLSGVRQTGGTFLLLGTAKFALAKPVKPMKRLIMKLITARDREVAKAKAQAKAEAKAETASAS